MKKFAVVLSGCGVYDCYMLKASISQIAEGTENNIHMMMNT